MASSQCRPCRGGISLDCSRWVACRPDLLLYVGVRSRLVSPARLSPRPNPRSAELLGIGVSGVFCEDVSPKKSLVEIGEPSHSRRFASERGELPWPSLGLDTSTLPSFAF